ncbi:uncharacterized [Tachysurus ichikawai]
MLEYSEALHSGQKCHATHFVMVADRGRDAGDADNACPNLASSVLNTLCDSSPCAWGKSQGSFQHRLTANKEQVSELPCGNGELGPEDSSTLPIDNVSYWRYGVSF